MDIIKPENAENEETRRLKRKFELVLSSAGEGIISFDSMGRIDLVNLAASRILEYAENELIGFSEKVAFHQILRKGEKCAGPDCLLFRALRNGETVRNDSEFFISKSGRRIPVEYIVSPIFEQEAISGAVMVFRDISERKKAEAEIRKAQTELEEARKHEMEIGFEIQKQLLFGSPPKGIDGFDFGKFTRPSLGIDGDFFDFFAIDQSSFDFLFGDVMGKGIPAALVASGVRSHFQRAMSRLILANLERREIPQPEEIVTKVHSELTVPLVEVNRFVSLHYCRFDLRTQTLSLVNCGHTPVIHFKVSEGETYLHYPDCKPLGIDEFATYKQNKISFERGDFFLFFSDGITDAWNSEREHFGLERLQEFVKAGIEFGTQRLMSELQKGLEAFTGGNNFSDDLTCVGIRIL